MLALFATLKAYAQKTEHFQKPSGKVKSCALAHIYQSQFEIIKF
jgi:hypothetical protein